MIESWVIDENGSPERIDTTIAKHLDISRARIQRWITDGLVQVNQSTVISNHALVKPGDSICVEIPKPKPTHLTPVAMPIDVQFEDDHILIINKPAGLTVHPGPGHRDDTLIHGLLHYFGPGFGSIGDVERPGLVHRLDQDTSGLMVVAKTDEAYQNLINQFKERTLKRTYQALVFGKLKTSKQTVDAPIGRHPRQRQRQAVISSGKPSVTHVKMLQDWCVEGLWISEVECQLETGRTHQIRVHMAHIGMPVIGDQTYGQATISKKYPETVRQFKRQALHASTLTLKHPVNEETICITTPPPEDYQNLIQSLGV